MSKTTSSKPIRLMLWTSPRSLSTVFSKAMSNMLNCVVFQEPFHTAYLYGPDRKHKTKEEDLPCGVETEYSYKKVQRMLEGDFPDADVIFVKDGPIAITDKYEYLPDGYIHLFLIRDPVEVATRAMGLNKRFSDTTNVAKETVNDYLSGSPYTDLVKLIEHVETALDQNPIIMDAGDLLSNPEAMMKEFCTRLGLTFTDRLLHWEPGVGKNWRVSQTKTFLNEKTGIYQKALDSSSFQSSLAKNQNTKDEIPEMFKSVLSVSVECYNKMYEKRIKV